eukprot:7262649-Alexandrium_andersonii.AAC.1
MHAPGSPDFIATRKEDVCSATLWCVTLPHKALRAFCFIRNLSRSGPCSWLPQLQGESKRSGKEAARA